MRFGIGTLAVILTMPTSWARADEANLLVADGRIAAEASKQAAGFDEWKRKVEGARVRRGRANTLILSGLGVGLATLVVGGVTSSHAMKDMKACAGRQQAALLSANRFSSTLPTMQPCSASSSPGLVLGAGGALAVGLGALGAFHRREAHLDLDHLYWEGQTRGYVSLDVTPRGEARVAYTLSF